MRVNVYEEEFTDDIQIVWVEPQPGKRFCGVRIFLHSSDKLHFTAEDDDRSAVTFWLRTPKHAKRFFENIAKQIDVVDAVHVFLKPDEEKED